MAIQTASGFTVGSSDPIDSRLVLSKEQMKTVNDNVFPEKYIAVCKDDGNIYIYQKSNEPDAELGKFRLFKSGGDSNFEEELKSFTQDKLDGNTGLPPSDIAIKNAMGEANGFATLDANGRIPSSMLPTSAREIVGYIDAGVDHNLPPEDGYESGNEIIITASGYILRSTSFSLPADSYINALEVNQANKLIGYGYVFTLFVDGSERGIVSGFSSNGVTLLSGDVIPIPNALELSVSSEPATVQQEVKEGDSFMLIGGHWILLSSSSGVESVNGKTGAVVVKELPIPESKDKLLLTTENAETTELEWSQVDKSEVGDVIHEYTLDEWEALSEDDKPPVGSKVIIKNDSEESMIDDESVSSSKVWSSRKVFDSLADIEKLANVNRRQRRDITTNLSNLSNAIAEQNLEKYGYTIGDYFVGASGYKYHLADLDTCYGGYDASGVVGTHHIGIVVDTGVNTAWLSSGTVTSYNKSTLHALLTSTVLDKVKSDITALFGNWNSHLLTHQMLDNAIGGWGDTWVADTYIKAMSEVEIYGSTVFGADGFQTGIANKKLSIFNKFKYNEIFGNKNIWLKSLSSASYACDAYNRGIAHYHNVSTSCGAVGLILFY